MTFFLSFNKYSIKVEQVILVDGQVVWVALRIPKQEQEEQQALETRMVPTWVWERGLVLVSTMDSDRCLAPQIPWIGGEWVGLTMAWVGEEVLRACRVEQAEERPLGVAGRVC